MSDLPLFLNEHKREYFISDLAHGTGLPKWFSKPVASTSLGRILEIQILRLDPRPPESETWKVGPTHPCFNKPCGWFWCSLRLENIGMGHFPLAPFQAFYHCLGAVPQLPNWSPYLHSPSHCQPLCRTEDGLEPRHQGSSQLSVVLCVSPNNHPGVGAQQSHW